ncbi:ABC transporter substrate-binding protein [Thioclava sp. GXIMD2076]|uniref:Thiamine pyrimidine synthase n=1 Tax=Thioclava kandeliae TaxID=3070818 RepID=A0ABV1SLS8_9RHOB
MNHSFTRTLQAGALLVASLAASMGQAAELDDVSIALPSSTVLPYHGFVFLGVPAGFYEKLGLDADVMTIQGSAAALQLVASGDADMGYMGLSALINAKLKQPDLPVEAVFLQDIAPVYSVAIPKGTGISGPEGLKGKRIGVLSMSSGAVTWVKAYMSKLGVAPDQYEIVAIGSGAQAYSLLKSGDVDAISFSRGLSAALEILGASFDYYAPPEPSGVIVANTKFLKEHPDVAARTLEGVVLNQTFMEINPEKATRYFWDFTSKPAGISEEEALKQGEIYINRTAEIWKDYKDSSTKWGEMSDSTWTGLMEFASVAEQFSDKAKLDAFVKSLYTDELIDQVNTVDLSIATKAAAQ